MTKRKRKRRFSTEGIYRYVMRKLFNTEAEELVSSESQNITTGH